MLSLQQLKEDILANGKVEGHEIDQLRQVVYANGKIDRRMADTLVELHKRVQRVTPAFEKFFYQAVKDHVLADGTIGREETAWLRQMLFTDDKIVNDEKKFLRELKGEAKQVSPEFEALCAESLKEKSA